MKKYFEENKEMITCECGCVVDKFSMRRHLLAKRHTTVLEYINKIKELENNEKVQENKLKIYLSENYLKIFSNISISKECLQLTLRKH